MASETRTPRWVNPDFSALPLRMRTKMLLEAFMGRTSRAVDPDLAQGMYTALSDWAMQDDPPRSPVGPVSACERCATSGVGVCDDYPNCPAGQNDGAIR